MGSKWIVGGFLVACLAVTGCDSGPPRRPTPTPTSPNFTQRQGATTTTPTAGAPMGSSTAGASSMGSGQPTPGWGTNTSTPGVTGGVPTTSPSSGANYTFTQPTTGGQPNAFGQPAGSFNQPNLSPPPNPYPGR